MSSEAASAESAIGERKIPAAAADAEASTTAIGPALGPDEQETYNCYVGELHLDATEEDLKQLYASAGPIDSCIIVRDKLTHAPKGFGFVNFKTEAARSFAIKHLHAQTVRGQICRIFRSDGKNTLWISGFPPSLNGETLRGELEAVGGPMVEFTLKQGCAFAKYINFRVAERASNALRSQPVLGRKLKVQVAQSKPQQQQQPQSTDGLPRTLYIRNLPVSVGDEELKQHFSSFGSISKCSVARDRATGQSRGFGFVDFDEATAAAGALSQMTGADIGGKTISIEYARQSSGLRSDRSAHTQAPSAFPHAHAALRGAPAAVPQWPVAGAYAAAPMAYDETTGQYVFLNADQQYAVQQMYAQQYARSAAPAAATAAPAAGAVPLAYVPPGMAAYQHVFQSTGAFPSQAYDATKKGRVPQRYNPY